MTSAVANEATLVAAARDGDRDAFRELYLKHVDSIFGFLVTRVGRQQAEDLTADTFARAYGAIGRFRLGEAPFRAWLFRIARNLIIERARKRRDETSIDGFESAGHHDVHETVAADLESERLRACLAELPEAHATVLELRFLRELSVSETAVALDLTEEAVRALTYRALKALRTLYEPQADAR